MLGLSCVKCVYPQSELCVFKAKLVVQIRPVFADSVTFDKMVMKWYNY